MYSTMTMSSLPKRFIDLTNKPCPYAAKIDKAINESKKETKQ